jgi:hypothetical protein
MMPSADNTVEEYLEQLPEERKTAMKELRKTVSTNLPKGFKEVLASGMICYVVPLSMYPDGYHCNPKMPLGFMSIVSQKNFISLHHLGIYGDPKLLKWFSDEYAKGSKTKLDMGKGCVRFKKPDQIPFGLIAELSSKISPQKWIDIYESHLKKRKSAV